MKRLNLRTERGTIMSSLFLVAMVVAVIAAALSAEGYKTPELDLHDGGVWVTWTEKGWIGRVNTQIAQVDVKIPKFGSDFELLQSGEFVFVHQPRALTAIDGRRAEAQNEPAVLPEDALVGLGGPGIGVEPTLAVLRPGTGQLWTANGYGLAGQTLGSDDPDDVQVVPKARVPGATDLVVGLDGIARVLVPKTSEIVGYDASGVEVDRVSIAGVDESHEFDLTVVGGTPVVLDRDDQIVLLPGGARLDLERHGGVARLQQPGPARPAVLVATDDELLQVPLDGGAVEVLSGDGTGGAANPVFVAGCAWAAWSGQPTYARHCDGATDTLLRRLPEMTPGKELRFRTNRNKVVINELETGRTFLLGDGGTEKVDWRHAQDPEDEEAESEIKTQSQLAQRDPEQKPPVAEDDTGPEGFATRPGRAVVVHPLRNDRDDNGDVLVIDGVDSVTPGDAVVQIVDGGLAVQVSPAFGSSAPVRFEYSINDGFGGSDSALAEVVVRDPGLNKPPRCDRADEPQKTFVRAGASVTHNVLASADDPDGDPVALLVPIELDSDAGTATADVRGTIVYRPPGVGFEGDVTVPYRLEDDQGGTTDCVLNVGVKGEAAANGSPTARNDHAVATVGQEVVVDVLANDSDPDGDVLRVISVDQFPGASIEVDTTQRVRVVPGRAGVMILAYQISDGPNPVVSGRLRIDVFDDPGQQPPVAVRDDVYLRPTAPAVVDVLANDRDPNDDVLVVVRVVVPADVPLDVEVVERQYLRISTSGGGVLWGTVQFQYVVSDGFSEASGMVIVRPGSPASVDQAPDAQNDDVTVRAGTIAALEVLANDMDPEGAPLTVAFDDAAQEPTAKGLAFAQGGLLRFLAPDRAETFRLTYQAVDPSGNRDAAFVNVHVLPPDVANNAPDAPDLVARAVAGRPVTIEIPVATMDRDGDAVVVLGVGDRAPAHGSVIAVGADRLTYVPDWVDTNGDGVPEGYFGSDTFSYRVRDTAASPSEAVGTIRVGVARPPTVNSPPVAIDDVRRVAAGGRLVIDVLRNDSDPDDDEITLDTNQGLGLPPQPGFDSEVRDGRVHFDAGTLEAGAEAAITYTVTDGILTDDGLLRVIVTDEGNIAPVAVDDVHRTSAPGSRVSVPVLENDFDPDGEATDLRVVEVSGPGRPSADGRSVELTMPDAAVAVVYVVEDAAGGKAQAVARVPVADGSRVRPVAVADEVTIGEGAEARVDVLANDVASPGTDKRLFDATGARNGTCTTNGDRVVYTPNAGFVGRDACAYLMGDGSGEDPETLRATGMLAIVVERDGNTPPVAVTQPLTVSAGGEVTRDLRFAVIDPDDGDRNGLTFSDVQGESGGITASFSGSVLTVRADARAPTGDVVLTYRVRDPRGGESRGAVQVSVLGAASATAPSPSDGGALAVLVPDRYQTWQGVRTEPLDVLANDQRAGNGDPLRIVAVSQPIGGTATNAATSITFDPSRDFSGETTFTYTVDDGTGNVARQVQTTVTVSVIGRPARPPAPAVTRESRAITLSWGVPASNGAPITEYRVKANGGPGGGVRTTTANTLRFDGLENGQSYTFQIAAVNAAVAEGLRTGAIPDYEYSEPSIPITPNAKPDTPNAPLALFTEGDHGGGTLTVSWNRPGGDGTPAVEYVLEISPSPTGGAQRTFAATGPTARHQIDGLTNGVPYRFRVQAFNVIEGSLRGESGWSGWSNAEVPATQPSTPAPPRIEEVGDKYIVVGWDEPAGNGDAVRAYVVQYSREGAVVGETGELQARSVRVDTTNGSAYTFRVKATNKAGFSPYSSASEPASSFGIPGPVTGLQASEGDGSSVLTVTGQPDPNGRPITTWEYRANGGAWSAFGGPGTGVPAQNGTQYQFQVRGCNARGCATDAGATSNQVTPYGVPPAPSVDAGVADTAIVWRWGETGNNGRPITAWQYRVNGGGWNQVGAGTTELAQDYGYSADVTFEVRGVNLRGPGQIGSARRQTIPEPAPQRSVTVSKGGTQGPFPNCNYSGCAFLRIAWNGFGAGAHTYRCYTANGTVFRRDNGTEITGTVSGSSGSQDAICYADASVYGGVYVILDGEQSPNANW